MVPPARISASEAAPLIVRHCSISAPGRGCRVIGEVGRGPVGVHVGEAAGHVPWPTGRILDCTLRRRPDAGVELLEAIPGDRGLEGVVQQAVGDQTLAVVGRTDEGLTPGIGQWVSRLSRRLRVEGRHRGRPCIPARGSSRRPRDGRRFRMPARRDENCRRPRPRAGPPRNRRGAGWSGRARPGPPCGSPPQPTRKSSKRSAAEARWVGRSCSRIQASVMMPRRALGADHQPVRARPRAGARQAAAFQRAGRRHRAQALHELVDVGVERGVVAAGAGGDPAAEGREAEGLREVPEREPRRP